MRLRLNGKQQFLTYVYDVYRLGDNIGTINKK
jgi:hypothetical protein